MTKLSKLVEHHLSIAKIVFKHIHKDEATGKDVITYIVNSTNDNTISYSVSCDDEVWSCDCPSFKFQTGTDVDGNCKHIQLVIFLVKNDIEIEVI